MICVLRCSLPSFVPFSLIAPTSSVLNAYYNIIPLVARNRRATAHYVVIARADVLRLVAIFHGRLLLHFVISQ